MAATNEKAAAEEGKTIQLSQEQVMLAFQGMRNDYQNLANKINELESERREHELVIDALKDLSDDRRCYRLIGGVLVERTVAQVRPAVKKNMDGIVEVIEQLTKNLKKKGQEMQKFQEQFNLQMKGNANEAVDERSEQGNKGVLV